MVRKISYLPQRSGSEAHSDVICRRGLRQARCDFQSASVRTRRSISLLLRARWREFIRVVFNHRLVQWLVEGEPKRTG